MKKIISLIMIVMIAMSLVSVSAVAEELTPAYEGMGIVTVTRNLHDTTYYNTTFANVVFDADGKIVDCYVDVLEAGDTVSTGATTYAVIGSTAGVTNEDGEVEQVEITEEFVAELVTTWVTKRERGYDYGMSGGAGEWFEQMDAWQEFFVGMTIDEIKAWAETGIDESGKPVDAISGATMSIQDAHSDILGAIYEAWDNKVDYVDAAKAGYGFTVVYRNLSDKTFYNITFSRVKLDENDVIVDNYTDVLETSDVSSTSATCPRYAIIGTTVAVGDSETGETTEMEITEEFVAELVSTWQSKRERGFDYGMSGGAGEWFEQMDAFQVFFNGMSVEEFTAYVADGLDDSGKPVDAVSGATMSVTDAHSDITGAMFKAIEMATAE